MWVLRVFVGVSVEMCQKLGVFVVVVIMLCVLCAVYGCARLRVCVPGTRPRMQEREGAEAVIDVDGMERMLTSRSMVRG